MSSTNPDPHWIPVRSGPSISGDESDVKFIRLGRRICVSRSGRVQHNTTSVGIEEFRQQARAWLQATTSPRLGAAWGSGDDGVGLFPAWERGDADALIASARQWLAQRHDAGFGGIAIPVDLGGRGLTRAHDAVYEAEEAERDLPPNEIWNIGQHMVVPAIARYGTDSQRERFMRPGVRGELLFCQLFSEPGAGSDLAGLSTQARQTETGRWLVSGQKVWTSVAHAADYGMLLARTGPPGSRHRGITCFLVSMNDPRVHVRPIKQMTGGRSFNEVFLDGVEIDDDHRLGDVDGGWHITRATLAAERTSLSLSGPHASPERLIELARHQGRANDPIIRQRLVDIVARKRIAELTLARAQTAEDRGSTDGPHPSLLKLMTTEMLCRMGATAGAILGPELVVDSGTWGTFAWSTHVMESAGLRIGGGTDEIQRNVIGETALGLPRDSAMAR
jgi:alkylation response protein AidB-like acyl-CoA dehydrogenase